MAEVEYPVVLEQDETTDGEPCYVARHPDLPGCMGSGYTKEAAIDDLRAAREAYIAVLNKKGLEVPQPGSRIARSA